MKKNIFCLLSFVLLTFFSLDDLRGQVRISSTPEEAHEGSLLDLGSNGGLLLPHVSILNANEFGLAGDKTAAAGLLVYNTNAGIANGDGKGVYV